MAKKLAMVLGVVFVLVGLLGFVSNPIVGANGFFMANTTHNVIHLLIGIIMLVMSSKGEAMASMSMTIFGVVYLLVAVLGFVASDFLSGLIMSNTQDTYLHLVLGVVLLALGMMYKGNSNSGMPMQQM